jgi:tRNA pseudouridine55 synthase
VLTELVREYSFPFGLDAACDLRDITGDAAALPAALRPIADALPHWSKVELTPDQALRVRNGMTVSSDVGPFAGQCPDGAGRDHALLLYQGQPLALAKREGASWSVLRGLWN